MYYLAYFVLIVAYEEEILSHQKAAGKGGHHLRLFNPLNTPLVGTGRRKRDPPHTNGVRRFKGVASLRNLHSKWR